MGLFDKKTCSVCGNDIGLLGNRKLEDGNLCKECARKLSPWFSDRRRSTVEEIKAQLAYREQNRANLSGFKPTKTFGEDSMKLHLDESRGQFVVTRSTDFQKNNPDLISLEQVKDCSYEVEEDKEEIFDKDSEGKKISFDPPKYETSYEFKVRLEVDSPYYPEIEFQFSDEAPESEGSKLYKELDWKVRSLQHTLMPAKYMDPGEFTYTGTDTVTSAINSANGPSSAGGTIPSGFATTTLEVPEGSTITPTNLSDGGAWTCECGTVNEGNFCSACGKPRAARWICKECGTENTGKFCTNCGHEAAPIVR